LVTGTCLEYGPNSGPIASAAHPSPKTPYAAAKDSLRQQLEFLSRDHPFCLQWARLFYMYGKGQNPKSILAQLDNAINNKDAVFNMSGGEQLRDYLPVEAVVEQLFCLFESNKSGVHNVCSGTPISIRRLVEERIKECGSAITINLGHYPYPEYEPLAFWGVRDMFKKP
jgi:dTDP-6-deoxy-L-talose 4-dehydrogenase (NAD+)